MQDGQIIRVNISKVHVRFLENLADLGRMTAERAGTDCHSLRQRERERAKRVAVTAAHATHGFTMGLLAHLISIDAEVNVSDIRVKKAREARLADGKSLDGSRRVDVGVGVNCIADVVEHPVELNLVDHHVIDDEIAVAHAKDSFRVVLRSFKVEETGNGAAHGS